jgi:steroid 5-alpha reductase family enzyme
MEVLLGSTIIVALISIIIHFIVVFIIAVKKNDFGFVDVGWGVGFVIVAWSTMIWRTQFLGVNSNMVGFLTLVLVTFWGTRLALHIGARNKGKPEDRRYTAMRAKIKPPFILAKSFMKIFLLQAAFMFLVSLVIIFNVSSGNIVNEANIVFVILGVFIWLVGYFFQAIGDQQLKDFITKPSNKGKLLTTGLWAYTRHPNYFGESLMWWGLAVVGFANSFSILFPLLGLISPIVITILVRYISGVPLLEKHMKTKPGFSEYEKTTSIFFPWFPKKIKIKD